VTALFDRKATQMEYIPQHGEMASFSLDEKQQSETLVCIACSLEAVLVLALSGRDLCRYISILWLHILETRLTICMMFIDEWSIFGCLTISRVLM
jgi:hypothetical protein